MFIKSLDEVGESVRGEFVEAEFEGEKGFQHKSTVALVNSLKNAKKEKEQYREKSSDFESKLTEFETEQQLKINEAAEKAYDKALKDKDFDAINAQHTEQIEYTKKTSFEAGKLEAQAEFKQQQSKARGDTVSLKLAGELGVDNFAIELLDREFRARIDSSGEEDVFLDVGGRATTLTQSEFKADILKDPRYSRLLKADLSTTGGGNIEGSNLGSASKKPSEMNSTERLAFKQRDPIAFKQAFNLN